MQVYVGLEKESAPNPQLKRIVKVPLKAGERKQIEISLTAEAFMLYDAEGRQVLNSGMYHIYVGGSQPDERSQELTGKSVQHFELNL